MGKAITVFCGLLAIFSLASGKTGAGRKLAPPRSIHIDGEKALAFISLLASGNARVDSELRRQPKEVATEIVIHDFEAVKESTYKYDPDDPYFKLEIYAASGEVDADSMRTRFARRLHSIGS